MKTGIIIQARTTSTRFPRKILYSLPFNSSSTVLDQVIIRTKRTQYIDEITVATTQNPEDDEIIRITKQNNVNVFRGSENDVLDRFYHTATARKLDTIVRITSDCPCIDSNVIDMLLKEFKTGQYDYLSNTRKRTFPHGLDVEVFSFDALTEAYNKAERQEFREHVTPYIYNTNYFNIGNLEASPACFGPDIRITLDTEEDYALLCTVYDYLYKKETNFSCVDIIRLFKEKKWLHLINNNVIHKKIFNSLEEEVEEALKILEIYDLREVKEFLYQKFFRQSD